MRSMDAPLVQLPFSEHESQLPLPQPMHREHSDCLPMVVGQGTGVWPCWSPTDNGKYSGNCPHEEFGSMEAMVTPEGQQL